MKVLVTRPQPAADTLARQLRAQGDEVVVCPALVIVGKSPSVEQQIHIATANCLVFVSVNAVRLGWAYVAARAGDSRVLWCAVGPVTANLLAAFGLAAHGIAIVAPMAPGSSAALLALPALQSMAGRKVVIVRGVGGLETLRAELQARGATVDVAEVYERVATPPLELAQAMSDGIDVIVVSSGEGLAAVHAATQASSMRVLKSTVTVIVPSSRIAMQAQRDGWSRVALSAGADDAATLATTATIRNTHGRA